jgi:hypothetical protein
MKSKIGKYVALIVGLLVAISAILTQTATYDTVVEKNPSALVTDTQNDHQNQGDTFIRLSPTSLPSSVFISFTHEAICLFEVLFREDSSSPDFETVARPLMEFFSVLLGAMISPNAP